MADCLADYSVEVGHVYLRDLRNRHGQAPRDMLLRRATTAQRWLQPTLDRLRDEGKSVTTCVLVDDYFWRADDGDLTPRKLGAMLVSAFAEVGLPIDHVAYEGALADSVDLMISRLVPRPLPGSGSVYDPSLASAGPPRWLTNGVPSLATGSVPVPRGGGWGETQSVEPQAPDVFGVAGQHRIALEVELRDESDRPWACPTLAAWWQLVRLGALQFLRGTDAPPGTERLNQDAPFAAKRTLTVLAPEFLEVEHAVRTILTQVHMEDEYFQWLQKGERLSSRESPSTRVASMAIAELAEMSHIFLPDDD